MYINFTTPAIVDLNATAGTAAWTWTTTKAGVINLNAAFGILEEAVAAGGFTTAAGDVTIQVTESGGAAVDVGAWSTGIGALCLARAIGYQANLTPNTTSAPGGFYKFGAGATIAVVNKAQGAGGTVTGTARVHVPVEFDAD
jgi:hypothetical protein